MIQRPAWWLFLLTYLSVCPYPVAVPEPARKPPATRQELIGAWQLVSIQWVGPNVRTTDPFFNADTTGILIYDPSGWMSVQIAGQPRPSMDAPVSRPAGPHALETAQIEAAVLDTYYAYAGQWKYDRATATVSHNVKTALIPGEIGLRYSQTVSLEGGNLTFTSPRNAPGGVTFQEKVWTRLVRDDSDHPPR
ncbi:MAG: lipocalin-like domain-containing protein [Pseudomonadota bacterium]|nr:lipocalin-like domain-containing protein [Pseudomonadota bacterium]